MLLINGMPVAVEFPERQRQPSLERRLRQVDCSRPVQPGCKQNVYMAKFVRFRPKPQPPEPAPVMERKWQECRRRMQQKRQRMAADRMNEMTQCALPPAELVSRPQAVQAATQSDLSPGNLFWLQKLEEKVVKTGLDASTQVSECDLTDVEAELRRLAESLVAATLEHAAVAVLSRDHVAALRREQTAYERKLLAEQVELDKLEHVMSLRRQRALRALAKAERANPEHAYRAVHSRALADHYMAGLCADALGRLESADYLQGENQFATWLRGQMLDHGCIRKPTDDHRLNALISDVIANRSQVHWDVAAARAQDDRVFNNFNSNT